MHTPYISLRSLQSIQTAEGTHTDWSGQVDPLWIINLSAHKVIMHSQQSIIDGSLIANKLERSDACNPTLVIG